jgi:hypothetical protein
MRTAENHLDNVCEGRFSKKLRGVFFTGKFHPYPFQFCVGGLPYLSLGSTLLL